MAGTCLPEQFINCEAVSRSETRKNRELEQFHNSKKAEMLQLSYARGHPIRNLGDLALGGTIRQPRGPSGCSGALSSSHKLARLSGPFSGPARLPQAAPW